MRSKEAVALVNGLDRETTSIVLVVCCAITETPVEVPMSEGTILKAYSTVAGWIDKNPESSEFWSDVLLKLDAVYGMSAKYGFSVL